VFRDSPGPVGSTHEHETGRQAKNESDEYGFERRMAEFHPDDHTAQVRDSTDDSSPELEPDLALFPPADLEQVEQERRCKEQREENKSR
jgi:hypothetical protein